VGVKSGEVIAWHHATREPVRVTWANGVINAVERASTEPSRDCWIAPSLVDLQVNGYAGIDFQQDNLSTGDLLRAIRGLRAAGCTRFLLTLVTDEWTRLMTRLRHLRILRETDPELRFAIAGWHIEGPFLCAEPGFCGAHSSKCMIDPTPDHIRELRDTAGSDPLMLTLAPERENAITVIEQATELGIKVSLGHTNAPTKRLKQALQYGAVAFTHLGNGCPRELDRHDNILWRMFDMRGLKVSLIPDAIHVSPPLFRLIHRELGAENLFYISDAMAAAGASPGCYRLGQLELEVGEEQIVRLPGKENFAGSALRPIDGVLRAAEMLDCPWQAAWPRFSERPASLMGFESGLEAGRRADFCLLEITPENQLIDLKVCANCELRG
jgi:N-acetylglucosamine-6-phosphate deacetylase